MRWCWPDTKMSVRRDGDLSGQPQQVRRVRAGRLKSPALFSSEGIGDGFDRGSQSAELRVLFGVMVKTATQSLQNTCRSQPREGFVDSRPAAQVQKSVWGKDRTSTTAVNAATKPFINALHSFPSRQLCQKKTPVFLTKKAPLQGCILTPFA